MSDTGYVPDPAIAERVRRAYYALPDTQEEADALAAQAAEAANPSMKLYAVEACQSNGEPYNKREIRGIYTTFREAGARAFDLSQAVLMPYVYRIIEFNEGREMPK